MIMCTRKLTFKMFIKHSLVSKCYSNIIHFIQYSVGCQNNHSNKCTRQTNNMSIQCSVVSKWYTNIIELIQYSVGCQYNHSNKCTRQYNNIMFIQCSVVSKWYTNIIEFIQYSVGCQTSKPSQNVIVILVMFTRVNYTNKSIAQ